MTSCFVARISNPGERFGKPFYEVDVPSPLRQRCEAFYAACFSLNSLSFSRSSMVMFLTSGLPSGFLSGFFGR